MSTFTPKPNSTQTSSPPTGQPPPVAPRGGFSFALMTAFLVWQSIILVIWIRRSSDLRSHDRQQWDQLVAKLTKALADLKSHDKELMRELSATLTKSIADLRSNDQQLTTELSAALTKTIADLRISDQQLTATMIEALQNMPSQDKREPPTLPPPPTDALPAPSLSPLKKGFMAAVTRSKVGDGYEEANQDAYHIHQAETYRLIAVADGVGAGQYSRIASQMVVHYFQEYIESHLQKEVALGLSEASDFYLEASEKIKEALERQGYPLNQAATTFIGLIEDASHYLLTYLGDGSVYRLTQQTDTHQFRATQLMLNNSSPQQPPQMWATGQSEESQEKLISKTKDLPLMWLIATDGMNDLAWDQQPSANQLIDQRAAEKLASELWERYQQGSEQFSEEAIKEVLMRWLRRCQTTDDATIAVLISHEMYAHWQKLGSLTKKDHQTNTSSGRKRVRYGQ